VVWMDLVCIYRQVGSIGLSWLLIWWLALGTEAMTLTS